jgi:4-amino-4-deoxy-L-arabinose transferase-like glycosyltransferase
MISTERERWLAARPRGATVVHGVLLAAVIAYASFLRLDALVFTFGPFTHPDWLVALDQTIRATRDDLVPPGWTWQKMDPPYVGGDPVNYIRFAREMRHFYQAHVREPVFLAVTRFFLVPTANQDVAVSFASVSWSVLAVFGTYLVGAAAASRWVGLAAAAAMAIEREVIAWSPHGWRDDAFTAMVAFCAWSILRWWQRRTWRTAGLAGALAGVACLTRITAASFVLPAFVLMGAPVPRAQWRRNLTQAVWAAGLATAIVAPYLVNCYREFGDPLYAINSHTRFYRYRSGEPSEQPQGALAYVGDQFRRRPVAAVDTALQGLFVYPFEIKWRGLDIWNPRAARFLAWLAAAGLFAWIWQPAGRLMLVVLITSLVPYMSTWSVSGGGEWRFTMHAYPFYLVAASSVVVLVGRHVRELSIGRLHSLSGNLRAWRWIASRGAVLACLVAAFQLERFWGPSLLVRETLQAGEAATIGAGRFDRVFFREGWSSLITTGAVAARFAVSAQPVLYVPLPEARRYRLVFRVDPVPADDAPPQRIQVFLDTRPLGLFALGWDPSRVGMYSLEVPADLANRRLSRLTLVADALHPAGTAAALYPGIEPSQPVAFRLWHVRVIPL